MTELPKTQAGTRPAPAALAAYLERAKQADVDSIEYLYRAYGAMVKAVALQLTRSDDDAEDVLHDVFVTLPARLERYRGKGTFDAWLRRVATTQALMVLRRRRIRNELPLPGDLAGHPSTDDAALSLDLARALEALPDHYRAVVVLHQLMGLTHAEIGEQLGISPGTSANRLLHARQQLRALLGTD